MDDRPHDTTTAGPAMWLIDALAWTAGFLTAGLAVAPTRLAPQALAVAVVFAVTLQAVIARPASLYHRRYAHGSLDEARAVCLTVGVTGALLWALSPLAVAVPHRAGIALFSTMAALLAMLGVRGVRRMLRERALRPDTVRAEPVLIFGAGAAGRRLLRSMSCDPHSPYRPVGLIDDDPAKRNLRVDGVAVLGGRPDLDAAARRTGVHTVIFAITKSSDGALLREVRRIVTDGNRCLKVLPSVSDTLERHTGVAEVRDVRLSDLLGRRQIETDLDAIAGYLTGKRVLVTGAGGSIGSELCRQLDRIGPAELMMLDRDESALHAVQLSLRGRALLDSKELILADLRDGDRIRAIFAERLPQVVFHAAALKHLTLLERHPAEALLTNVLGTLTVLEAAEGVERFINISTDKAANPQSVLGSSKRITERLTAYTSKTRTGTFLNVRFGNVLGSRGSVLTAFHAQIAGGGPVTVTDPDVTRYFMTVQEAVQLVIQAAAIGGGGEALVLDMGEPVRIDDVARQLVARADRPIEVVYTGLRPGEKLHEELFGAGERDVRPLHPLISHVQVPPLDPALARAIDPRADGAVITGQLADLCVVPWSVLDVAELRVAAGALR